MRTHCTGRQAGQLPGPMLRPCRGAQACGLQEDGLPHQRARGFAMTDLGVRRVWRQRGGSGKLTAGASPRPTVRVSAMHPAQRTRLRSCTRRAGARPRRAPANLPGTLAPTDQAPEPVIARSAATWQSVSPQCECIAPAVRPVIDPGPHCAPGGARKPWGLRGNGLPRPLRGLAMTGLEVRWVWMGCGGFGRLAAGASPRPTVRATTAHP